eukprot:TRINITY_DN46591_c0_g1_i1.p1 TRINITY_DN46591_c0_g1~~TRINITY_DN46591_c0_g1_i1.p1  ORF type:complete len:162 (+),score=51.82 TRINITY_DN46591_c0_g1_i1:36-488(+)
MATSPKKSPVKTSQRKAKGKKGTKKEKKSGEKKKMRLSSNGKRISKSKFTSYARYIHKILPDDTRISARGMAIVNSYVHDLFERLASEAGRVAKHAEQKTISSNAMIAAVKLQLPKDFAQASMQAGAKAMNNYYEKTGGAPKKKGKKSKK